MIAGVRGSWQTIIADLSLILFMVTAAAMNPKASGALDNPLPARGEPTAIYRVGEGAPPLGAWLAAEPADDRQQLTVVARYPVEGMREAADTALALSSEAEQLGLRPRILLEPAPEAEVFAVLAFDDAGGWHTDCMASGDKGARRASGKDDPCE